MCCYGCCYIEVPDACVEVKLVTQDVCERRGAYGGIFCFAQNQRSYRCFGRFFFTLGGICSLITGLRGFELPEDTPDLIVEYMEEVSLDYYTIRLGFDGEFVSDRRIVEIKVVDDEH